MTQHPRRPLALATAALGAAVIIATATPQAGRAAVIDFDSLPASTNVSGVPDNAASVLTTQLDTDGVIFGRLGVSAGVAVVQLATFDEVSPPNTIVGLDALGEIPAFASGDIHFRFVLPGTGLPGITNTVSFQVGDDCCDEDSFVVRAYDLADTVLDTQLIVGNSWQPYALAMPGIHRIHIENVSPHTSGYAVDDLAFATPTAVPAPGAVGLFALAGIALIARRRQPR
jgi:hypothetical protein